ncbi:MAG: hypothetical protein NC355_06245 [Blautia sp.]|nr:hypothetical protein [Blautia sp.]
MNLEILQNEERRMNMIFFIFDLTIPVVALLYVLFFNGASLRDIVVLLMPLSGG